MFSYVALNLLNYNLHI